jgi:hypothetical protein
MCNQHCATCCKSRWRASMAPLKADVAIWMEVAQPSRGIAHPVKDNIHGSKQPPAGIECMTVSRAGKILKYKFTGY